MDDPNFESFQLGGQAYCAARTDAGYSHKIAIPATNNWNIVLTYDGDHMTLLDYEIGVKDIRLG